MAKVKDEQVHDEFFLVLFIIFLY